MYHFCRFTSSNSIEIFAILNIREHCVAPKLATLYWDSKLIPALSNQIKLEECFTAIVSNSQELKLLDIPAYKPGMDCKSGDIIADIYFDLLSSCNCMDSIVNMAFNKTSSNTVYVTAGPITIHKKLGKALLWSAYCDHVVEIILSHILDNLQT